MELKIIQARKYEVIETPAGGPICTYCELEIRQPRCYNGRGPGGHYLHISCGGLAKVKKVNDD